jgi:hypothetical protein
MLPWFMLEDSLRALRDGVAHALAAEHDLEEFAGRIWRLLQRLNADPVLAGHLADFRAEDHDEQQRRGSDYFRLLDELGTIRRELEEVAPSIFAGPEPEDDGQRICSHWALDSTIKNTMRDSLSEDASLNHWIAIVASYLERGRCDVSSLEARLSEVRDAERLSRRRYRLRRSSAGRAANWVHRHFKPLDTEAADRPVWDDFLGAIAKLIDGGEQSLDEFEVKHLRNELGPNLRRIEAELAARIGSVRSKLALFARFKQRAEWHDRDRLRELASGQPKKAELNLTRELALFLFDRGLNPLTEVNIGNRRLDVFDLHSKVYVEAKQYKSSKSTKEKLKQAVAQAFDAMAVLAGTPSEVHEAFLPIFRWTTEQAKPPPRYDLPRELRLGRYRVYPLLIDIAPSSATGSRAGRRIELTEEDLLA